ncbi:MAG: lysophospholipid acyltransferase family protein [Acidobacteria bacterium]|nr:lysophospholipid acyltransferase family protein [Acidobacteriota bacterium]
MPSRLSRGRRVKAAAIAAAGAPVIAALGRTYHWHETGTEHLDRIHREGRQPIYALWHGRIMPGILYLRDRGIVVITSENFDGEWIARVIRRFGFGTARGSSSRGGAKALVQLRRDLRAGRPVAFTIDGPRGPREVAQPGAVWLAGATGQPILPFHIESSSFWTAKSWDRHQVPKPGSHVAVAMGPPIEVPAGADDAAIDAGRLALEAALARLKDEAIGLIRAAEGGQR